MFPTLKGFSQQLISVNGIKINAVTGGEGPPILLLRGWPETWWERHDVMPLLAEHFSVVAMDLRGAGFSDCPRDGYDKATMARDAHEVMRARSAMIVTRCVGTISAAWSRSRKRRPDTRRNGVVSNARRRSRGCAGVQEAAPRHTRPGSGGEISGLARG